MSVSSSIYREEQAEIQSSWSTLSDAEKKVVGAPFLEEGHFGEWWVVNPNFAYQYTTSYRFNGTRAKERAQSFKDGNLAGQDWDDIKSWHWGDAYAERNMLALMKKRLGEMNDESEYRFLAVVSNLPR